MGWHSAIVYEQTCGLRRLHILVQRLPADVEVAGDLRFVLACADTLQHDGNIIRSQLFLAAFVDAFPFCDTNALPLRFTDDHTLELGKGSEYLKQQDGERAIVAGKGEVFSDKCD